VFLYLDTSAVVKLVTEEPDTAAVESALAHCEAAFSSRLAVVECARAIARASDRTALTTSAEIFEALVLHEVNEAVLERAATLTPSSLRSLEAIHLATALLLGQSDLAFVTYDDKLARAAEAQGLSVLQPRRPSAARRRPSRA
jgi:predicted nucleic acid-binding protein